MVKSGRTILRVKEVKFSFLTQYEIVSESKGKSKNIVYQTSYVKPEKGRKIDLLIREEEIQIEVQEPTK